MSQGEFQHLRDIFKLLADENRLKMVGILAKEELTVGQLAARLGLTEPTVSHHLARLREMGVATLRADGNNRFYRLNADALKRWKKQMNNLENIKPEIMAKPDMSWVENLNMDAEDQKVLKAYFDGKRLKQIPTKEKKLLVVLRWLTTQFEPGQKYTEQQVNEIIGRVYDDYVTLRRSLVDYHLLERESGGGLYWRADNAPDA